MEHLAVLGVEIDTEIIIALTPVESELFPVKMPVSLRRYPNQRRKNDCFGCHSFRKVNASAEFA